MYVKDSTKYSNKQIGLNFFNGKFPKRPPHTCEHWGRVVSNSKGVALQVLTQDVWRKRKTKHGKILDKCPACNYTHVYKSVNQIVAEVNDDYNANWGYAILPIKQFDNFRKNYLRKIGAFIKKSNNADKSPHRLKYIAFPHKKTYTIVHNTGLLTSSRIIPLDIERLFVIVADATTAMTGGSRVRKSQGFGLHYGSQRLKSKPTPIALTFNEPHKVRRLLQKHKAKYTNNAYEIDILDLLDLMADNNIKFHIQKGAGLVDELRLARSQSQLSYKPPTTERVAPSGKTNMNTVQVANLAFTDAQDYDQSTIDNLDWEWYNE